MTEAASNNTVDVTYEAREQLGADMVLAAVVVTAESHPNEVARQAARAMLDSYQEAVLEMQVAPEPGE